VAIILATTWLEPGITRKTNPLIPNFYYWITYGLLCSILILSNGIAFFSLIHSPEESMVSKREIERRKGIGQGIGRGWNKFPR